MTFSLLNLLFERIFVAYPHLTQLSGGNHGCECEVGKSILPFQFQFSGTDILLIGSHDGMDGFSVIKYATI